MRRKLLLICVMILAGTVIGASFAKDASAEKLKKIKLESDVVNVKASGVYNVWGLSQNNFFFGARGAGKGRDDYVLQLLRFKLQLADKNDDIRVVTRFDFAQGWWGVDNAGDQNVNKGLFLNKNTFFDVHIDHAYLDFKVPGIDNTRMHIGRMHFNLGNKLVLDDDVDGLKISTDVGPGKVSLSYGKFFEGDTCSNPSAFPIAPNASSVNRRCDASLGSVNDRGNAGDANMGIIQYDQKLEKGSFSAWYLFYSDAGTGNGTAYITNGLGYNRPRFTPQVSELNIIGASGKYTVGNVTVRAEGDYLKGKDNINNLTYNSAANDINNGSIGGATFYVDTQYTVSDQANVGFKFGYGTGDDDPKSGKGNITKLKTQGFFYFTEVWEDSIMPDVAGISPQGIGAPNTRGYREFENTTAFQVYANYKPIERVNLYVSYSYMLATQSVNSWSKSTTLLTNPLTGLTAYDTTPDGKQRSNKLGQEIDATASLRIYQNLALQMRGGYFIPGAASTLLVNGNTKNSKHAWELKTMLTYRF